MNAKIAPLLLMGAALLAGCATQSELIEKRIGQKADFFAKLPPEKQQQLREGRVVEGDPLDAAWIVYGKPDRVFQKVTGTVTNEVWSYISATPTDPDAPNPVYHPVRAAGGRTFKTPGAPLPPAVDHHRYEYLRLDIRDGRIHSLGPENR